MCIFGKTYPNDDGVEFLELVKFSLNDPNLETVLFLNVDNIDEETDTIDTIIKHFCFFYMIKRQYLNYNHHHYKLITKNQYLTFNNS